MGLCDGAGVGACCYRAKVPMGAVGADAADEEERWCIVGWAILAVCCCLTPKYQPIFKHTRRGRAVCVASPCASCKLILWGSQARVPQCLNKYELRGRPGSWAITSWGIAL